MKQALIGILIAIGLYAYGHHKGWSERDAEMQAEIASKNEEARTKEQELNAQLNNSEAKLLEANNAINQKQSALDAAIRAGRVRLNYASCVQTGTGSSPTTSGGAEAASESERQTLAAIAEIVAQGDRNTEQLNACIDAYNQAREMVNGQR